MTDKLNTYALVCDFGTRQVIVQDQHEAESLHDYAAHVMGKIESEGMYIADGGADLCNVVIPGTGGMVISFMTGERFDLQRRQAMAAARGPSGLVVPA